jgi:hypothetical protein
VATSQLCNSAACILPIIFTSRTFLDGGRLPEENARLIIIVRKPGLSFASDFDNDGQAWPPAVLYLLLYASPTILAKIIALNPSACLSLVQGQDSQIRGREAAGYLDGESGTIAWFLESSTR